MDEMKLVFVYAADGGLDAEAENAHILALRFKEPTTSLGSEETP